MRFAREGLAFIVVAFGVAGGAMAFALLRRSWPLWLLAAALLVVALWIAYVVRDADRIGERGDRLSVSPASGRVLPATRLGAVFVFGAASGDVAALPEFSNS